MKAVESAKGKGKGKTHPGMAHTTMGPVTPPGKSITAGSQLQLECELQEKLSKATAEIQSLTKYKVAYTIMLVPQLAGVKGKDWKLVELIGLENDKAQYNQIICGLCQCMAEAGMEEGKRIHAQAHGRLTQYYNVACERFLMLACFGNDWVSKEFLKQNLHDRCKYNLKVKEEAGENPEDGEDRSGSNDDDA
ncbi:hypothetical protein FRB94_012134 [Tulasnella sp. JGI-2019a]|nr:hypothetical protein FRB94_012134 [Tulasnella sp. JGI-2019a]